MKKHIFALAGASVTLASAVALLTYTAKKKKNQNPSVALLLSGTAGCLLGTALAVLPEILDTYQKLAIDDLMDEEDLALMEQHIAEVLSPESHAKEA